MKVTRKIFWRRLITDTRRLIRWVDYRVHVCGTSSTGIGRPLRMEWRVMSDIYFNSLILKSCFGLFGNLLRLSNQPILKTDGPLWASECETVCRAQTAYCSVICKWASIEWQRVLHMRGILALNYFFIYKTSEQISAFIFCMVGVNIFVNITMSLFTLWRFMREWAYSSTHSSVWHEMGWTG